MKHFLIFILTTVSLITAQDTIQPREIINSSLDPHQFVTSQDCEAFDKDPHRYAATLGAAVKNGLQLAREYACYYDNLQDLPAYDSTTTRTGTSPFFVSVNPVYAANGNVLRVDARFGNDSYGARNGLPFLTIGAAITASRPGDVIRVFPGTYNNEILPLTISDGVTVSGVSQSAVIISKFVSTVTDTDLVRMGATGVLENVTLSLTSNQHATFNGVNYTATPVVTSLRNVNIIFDNSTASGAGSSNVRGVFSGAAGVLVPDVIAMQNCTVTVTSQGAGGKRGVTNAGVPGTLNLQNCVITATGGTAGDTIAFRTSQTSAVSVLTNCTLNGSTFDVAQLGPITLNSCTLVNSTSGGVGFFTGQQPTILTWGAPAATATTTVMAPGFGALVALGNEAQVQFVPQPTRSYVAKSLSVAATVGPTTSSDEWRLAVNTTESLLRTRLTPGSTQAFNMTAAVTVATEASLSVHLVGGAGGARSQNPVVTVELY